MHPPKFRIADKWPITLRGKFECNETPSIDAHKSAEAADWTFARRLI